jgi:hypothetical protein
MTFITQAIETKYLGPTNTRGGRIKARAWSSSLTVPYDHALNPEDNHRAAADALRAKLGWEGTFAQGGHPNGCGYVFVNVEGAPA